MVKVTFVIFSTAQKDHSTRLDYLKQCFQIQQQCFSHENGLGKQKMETIVTLTLSGDGKEHQSTRATGHISAGTCAVEMVPTGGTIYNVLPTAPKGSNCPHYRCTS